MLITKWMELNCALGTQELYHSITYYKPRGYHMVDDKDHSYESDVIKAVQTFIGNKRHVWLVKGGFAHVSDDVLTQILEYGFKDGDAFIIYDDAHWIHIARNGYFEYPDGRVMMKSLSLTHLEYELFKSFVYEDIDFATFSEHSEAIIRTDL